MPRPQAQKRTVSVVKHVRLILSTQASPTGQTALRYWISTLKGRYGHVTFTGIAPFARQSTSGERAGARSP